MQVSIIYLAAPLLIAIVLAAAIYKVRETERKNRARLKDMLEAFPGVFFMLDNSLRFLMVNKGFVASSSVKEEALIGRTIHEALHPAVAGLIQSRVALARAKSGHMEFQDEYKLRSGVTLFEIRLFALRDRNANPEAWCVFGLDVTSWKKLEREREEILLELAASTQRYQSFVSNSTEQMWRVEMEPPIPISLPIDEFIDACYERGVIREANEVAARRYGLTLDQLIGRRLWEVRDRSLAENNEADRKWYLNNFQMYDFVSVQKKDAAGKRIYLMTNTIGIVENGFLVRGWGIQRDVTQSRRLQEMLTNAARGVSAETGSRFFDLLVEHLATTLEAQCAFVAEFEEGDSMHILALWSGWQRGRELLQPITETPAAKVKHSKLAELFTGQDSHGFATAEAFMSRKPEACLVEPLIVSTGKLVGFLVLLYETQPQIPTEAMEVLEIYSARAAAELERQHITDEVLRHQGQLSALSARNQQMVEAERSHLAREIHDELGQHLTAIKIGLSAIRNKIQKGAAESALPALEELKELTDETVRSVRRIATELRPPALDSLGLGAAVRWQAKEAEQRLGIPVDCRISEVAVPDIIATSAFRILQESLTNIARHAKASLVEVRLEQNAGVLRLSIRDDGAGFDPGLPRQSLGLLGMHERAAAVGGSVLISSVVGEGTTVTAELPGCLPELQGEKL